jgi:hypothetical protein
VFLRNDATAPPPSIREGRKAMDDLGLKYDKNNKKDVNWLPQFWERHSVILL